VNINLDKKALALKRNSFREKSAEAFIFFMKSKTLFYLYTTIKILPIMVAVFIIIIKTIVWLMGRAWV